jgi:hypothetical protein
MRERPRPKTKLVMPRAVRKKAGEAKVEARLKILVSSSVYGYDEFIAAIRALEEAKFTIWVRIGKKTLRASEEQSAEIVERSAVDLDRWERAPMPGFEKGDCDPEELRRAREEIATGGDSAPQCLTKMRNFSGGSIF